MYIDSYNYTNNGKYPINEDSFFRGENIFIVADGLGGHGGGETASACAVRYITEHYPQEISELISGANNAVYELDNGSRSTVAAAFVEDGIFRYINVGDSRVYFFRNGKILCRTKDHSVCQAAVDAGTMTEDEIRGHEDRSRLLKVLGENETLKLPSYEPISLRNGDAFLICSDGFWDFVYETEMEVDLLKSDSAKRWGDLMLRRHLKRSHCEDDNFTLVCGIIHREETDITHTSSPAEIVIDRPEENAGQKKDHRAVIGFVIGILVCAALLIGGFFLYSHFFGDKNNSQDSTATESTSESTVESSSESTTESSSASTTESSSVSTTESSSVSTTENSSASTTESSSASTTESSSVSTGESSSEVSSETTESSDDTESSGRFPLPSLPVGF